MPRTSVSMVDRLTVSSDVHGSLDLGVADECCCVRGTGMWPVLGDIFVTYLCHKHSFYLSPAPRTHTHVHIHRSVLKQCTKVFSV